MGRMFCLMTACLLAGCASNPPPLDPRALPPVEESRDWDDWSQEKNQAKRLEGQLLTTPALQARFVGQVLNVCFPSGERVSERLDTTGRFYDTQSGEALGTYRIDQDRLCFLYPDNRTACYSVSEKDGEAYFYSPGGYRLVAATKCPIPRTTKGFPAQSNSSN